MLAALLQPRLPVLDVVVVGGGPAGLNAALILGRCRRAVVVLDAGSPRNARSHALHGFLSRDGIAPGALLRRGREELARYAVDFRAEAATDAARADGGFAVSLAGGDRLEGRTLLLATGVVDCLPQIDGMADCYGTSVFHCPYCDAWEVRDEPLALYARGRQGVGMALALTTWSGDVVLCTDGPARLSRDQSDALHARNIGLREEPIGRLAHRDGRLEALVFRSAPPLARRALFFRTGQYTRSPLAERLGCRFTAKGAIRCDALGATGVPGLYVAGDASRDVQFAVVAAAEGAKVGYAINEALHREALRA